jgi:hypothetical protein
LADLILIPKKLRLDWMDVMAVDPLVLPTQYKVVGAISSHLGNKSGLTYVGQDRLARVCGLSLPTVNRAIGELERMGYLIVRRKEVGVRGDGQKVYGGRGTANVYLPACDAAQVSVTDPSKKLIKKLVDNARLFWDNSDGKGDKNHLTNDVLPCSKHVMGDVVFTMESISGEPLKHITHDVPTLKLPTEANSIQILDHRAVDGLGVAGDALRKRLGDDAFKSWFLDKIAVCSEDGDTVTLSAPTAFHRDYIVAQYDDAMLHAWRRVRPVTKRVAVIVVADAGRRAVVAVPVRR